MSNPHSISFLQFLPALTEWVDQSVLMREMGTLIEFYKSGTSIEQAGEWLVQREIARTIVHDWENHMEKHEWEE